MKEIYQRILSAKRRNEDFSGPLETLQNISKQTPTEKTQKNIGLANYYLSKLTTDEDLKEQYFRTALELEIPEALYEKAEAERNTILRRARRVKNRTYVGNLDEAVNDCLKLIGDPLTEICTKPLSLEDSDTVKKEALDLLRHTNSRGQLLWAHYQRHVLKNTHFDSIPILTAQAVKQTYESLVIVTCNKASETIAREAHFGLANLIEAGKIGWFNTETEYHWDSYEQRKIPSPTRIVHHKLDNETRIRLAIGHHTKAAELGFQPAEDALMQHANKNKIWASQRKIESARDALISIFTKRCEAEPQDKTISAFWEVTKDWENKRGQVQQTIINILLENYKQKNVNQEVKTLILNWIEKFNRPAWAVMDYNKIVFDNNFAKLAAINLPDSDDKSAHAEIKEIIKAIFAEINEALDQISQLAIEGHSDAIKFFNTASTLSQNNQLQQRVVNNIRGLAECVEIERDNVAADTKSSSTSSTSSTSNKDNAANMRQRYEHVAINKLSLTNSEFYKIDIQKRQDAEAHYLSAQWYENASPGPLMQSGKTKEAALNELKEHANHHLKLAAEKQYLLAVVELLQSNQTLLTEAFENSKNNVSYCLYQLSLQPNGQSACDFLAMYDSDPIAIVFLSKVSVDQKDENAYLALKEKVVKNNNEITFSDDDIDLLKTTYASNEMANLLLVAYYRKEGKNTFADAYQQSADYYTPFTSQTLPETDKVTPLPSYKETMQVPTKATSQNNLEQQPIVYPPVVAVPASVAARQTAIEAAPLPPNENLPASSNNYHQAAIVARQALGEKKEREENFVLEM